MTFVKTLRRGCMAALLLSFALATGAVAQPQDVIGARVTLEPPAGFTPADRFPGFEHAPSGASIMVTEMPAEAFVELRDGFTAEALAARGMTLRASEALTIGGREGVLLAVSQSARGTDFHKWIALFGGDSATVIVTGTYPAAAAGELGESMRQAVLSARLREGPPRDPFEGLAFRIVETPHLKIATRMTNMIALNESGDLSHPRPGEAVLVVGLSFSEVQVGDVEAFARRRIQQIATVSDVGAVRGGPVTIDGLAGHELFAEGRNVNAGIPMRIYQVLLPDGAGYILVQGVVRADRADELIPEFQAVAHSLRRTQ